MSLPVQFFVPTCAENVNVGFGLLAQPNLRALDSSDDTRGEVNGPAKDIAFFYLQGTDMDPALSRSSGGPGAAQSARA